LKVSQEMRKAAEEAAAKSASTKKAELEVAAARRKELVQQVASLNTPDEAVGLLQETGKDLPPQLRAGLEKLIRTDPKWQLKLVMGISDPAKMVEILKPLIQTRDTGGAVQTLAIDQFTGVPSVTGSVAKTATPDALLNDERQRREGDLNRGVQWARLNVDKAGQDLQREAARVVVVDTAEGPALADKGTGKVRVLTGADGNPLGRKLKDLPASVQTALISNSTNLRRAENALALVQGKDIGDAKGDKNATGLKGYLPNQVLNRIDPLGVDARAQIADLGSLVIHERSGAAVTAAEFPRLAPFIPTEKDDPPTVQKKLKRFIQVYKEEMAATDQMYGPESGYRQLGGRPPTNPTPPPSPSDKPKPGTDLGDGFRLKN